MERLWNLAAATGGKPVQMRRGRKLLRQAKTVAAGCHRLPPKLHSKEGFKSAGGLFKLPVNRHLLTWLDLQELHCARVWSRS
jgi:hypothetical protein